MAGLFLPFGCVLWVRSVNPADLPQREQARAHIAGLFNILGRPFDEFRPVWSGLAHGPRRTLLILADMPQVWANRAYDELSPQTVIELKARVMQLRDWLNKVLPE